MRHVLPAISVPALILHRTGDLDVNIEEGRWLASQIPGARFVELQGDDHMPWAGDQDSIVDEVQEFLTGIRPPRDIDRVLATVLFTDIVGSTERMARVGLGARRVAFRLQKVEALSPDGSAQEVFRAGAPLSGARISAGKSGSVEMSLPRSAVSDVNCEPVSCMPSPESPAKRTITWESCSTGLLLTASSQV